MSVPSPIDSEFLLEHAAWVRRLARSLVADAHLADDLAQDTCIAALERPPARDENPRGWLAQVLRNFHRQELRARDRRTAREGGVAREEAQPSAADVLERAALHGELYEAVMQLGEPYRSAILLRYFDELPLRKIAAQLGVPVETVHSRVQRGLAELRGRLTRRRGGDTRAWVLALLPLAEQPGPWSPGALGAPLGALLMDVKVKVGLAVALLACGVLGVWTLVHSPATSLGEAEVAAAPAAARSRPERPAESPLAAIDETPERAAAVDVAAVEEAPKPPRAAVPEVVARGRVLDVRGSPVAGVEVALGPGGGHVDATAPRWGSATSDASGRFELELPPGSKFGEIVALDPLLTNVMAGSWESSTSLEVTLVVAPLRPLAGKVRDEHGAPIAGAHVGFQLDPGFESRFASVLEASSAGSWEATCDEHGAFSLPDAPAVDGSRLFTSREGYASDERPSPDAPDPALEIVLLRSTRGPRALEGVVVAPDGKAVPGAHVSLGERATLTDEQGRFSLELSEDDPAELLMALKQGFLPATMTAAPASAPDAPRWPAFVRLALGGPPLSIEGVAVDEDGRPLAEVQVWVDDPTWFGFVNDEPAHAELLLATEARSAFWSPVTTNRKGRFTLEGLLPRSYVVKAMHNRSLILAQVGPVVAGSPPLRIVLPTRARRSIEGRVVGRAGQPLPGVEVHVRRHGVRVERNGNVWQSDPGGESEVTDERGRFLLEGAPRDGVYLVLSGDSIVDSELELEDGERDVRDLEAVATVRHHFQLELDEPVGRADHFQILDGDGTALQVLRIRGFNVWSTDMAELEDGRTPVLSVSEEARTLVLYRGVDEVERHPIVLLASTTNTLRF